MKNSETDPRWLGLVVLAGLAVGCGYGPVSPAAFQHAKALYTVANLRASDGVAALDTRISGDLETGVLTEREAGWLRAIAEDCRTARWDAAQAAARRMMEDQAGR